MIARGVRFSRSQLAFSLFELILVIVIVGLLAAAAVKYYMDLREEALRTAVQTQARNFAGAIQMARADWLTKQPPEFVPTRPGQKISLDLDGTLIYVNEWGWPANTSAELDSSSDSQTAAECHELWVGLMQNPQPATVEGLSGSAGEKGQHRYHISANAAKCRFEAIDGPWPAYYYEYDLKTGKVTIDASLE